MSEEKNTEAKSAKTEASTKKMALGCLTLIVIIAIGWYFVRGFFVPEPTNYVTQENTQERLAEEILIDSWGALTNWEGSPQRFKNISTMQIVDGKALDVTLRINDNLTSGFIEGGFINDCTDSVQKLFAAKGLEDITIIRFLGSLNLVDKYGKKEEHTVVKMHITRNLAEKVNRENVLTDNVPQLVTEEGGYFWLHPALRK